MSFRKRIGNLLLEAGLITEEQLQNALREQKGSGRRLGDELIRLGYITEQQFIEVLTLQLGIPYVPLYKQKIDQKIVNLIPPRIAEQYKVIPIREESNKLFVAMADPLDYFAIDELRMLTGYHIEPMLAAKEELNGAIQRYYGLQESLQKIMEDLEVREELREYRPHHLEPEEESPVVNTVNEMIRQAVQLGASDIHIDPQEDGLKIRYRIDGVMRTERTIPSDIQGVITARLKVMGQLNVSERRLPQDGRIEMDVDYRKIDIRISTLPTLYGEKVVLRLLDQGSNLTDIEKLDFSDSNLRRFLSGIRRPYGIVLITGPTGSGKTTTLYSALSVLNSEEVNIVTIEDPVEYHLPGVNQVQVNPSIGLTFAQGLRSILRQDPNIIVVGEIRDGETAEIAVRAAMTGHLVLSTLHTNSAVNTITRLIDMGVERFLLSSSLTCVVAQRLVRRVCTSCSVKYKPSPEEKKLLEDYGFRADELLRGEGCNRCGRTGYKGRMAIHEVLTVDEKLRALMMEKRADDDFLAHAKAHGMVPMIIDGLSKAAAGRTTVSEVLRVCTDDAVYRV